MEAWQLVNYGQKLELHQVPDPRTVAPDDVVIRVRAAGICHSDLSYRDGHMDAVLGPLPITLGHEIAGEVEEVGADVTHVKIGDRVAVNSLVDGPGTAVNGGYAEKVVAHVRNLVHIPDDVDFAQAAAATDAGRTAMHAVRSIGRVDATTKVGIIGLGALGLVGAQLAVHFGATVFAAEPRESAHQAAKKAGVRRIAADVTELRDEDLDVIIDFAGFGTTTDGAIEAVRFGGTVIQVGMAVARASIDLQLLSFKEVELKGSIVGSNEDIKDVLDLIAEGVLRPVITSVSFDEVPEAMARLERGDADGRLVIEML